MCCTFVFAARKTTTPEPSTEESTEEESTDYSSTEEETRPPTKGNLKFAGKQILKSAAPIPAKPAMKIAPKFVKSSGPLPKPK